MTRLARNQAGNVMAMYAAALIPLLGLLGGGIDMSRIYLAKTRLQQACDAGALAGRKQMAGGLWSANNGEANTVAANMFNANFQSGAYGTTGLTKSYSESNGMVTGIASVQVPMAVMQLFGQSIKTINVTCEAEMKIPNTDVMFVLDVTGSMSSTNYGDSDTKINGLKMAVRCFFETLAQIDTVANCGSTPSGSPPNAQLRFGFVPYSTNVNVGKLLNNQWMADNWTYQSRQANMYVPSAPSVGTTSQETSYSFSKKSKCQNWASGSTTSGLPASNSAPPSFTMTTYSYSFVSWNSGTCVRQVTPSTTIYTKDDNGSFFLNWTYKPVTFNVSGLKAGGSNWNSSVTLPVGSNGANTAITWNGCIEERQTVSAASYSPIPNGANDLNIDMTPSAGDSTTQWGPALSGAVWGRYDNNGNTLNEVTTTSSLSHNIGTYCPAAARRLQMYTGSTDFDTYVSTLTPTGNTYHDIGLIWGARLLSPTGLFASENAFTPSGGDIQRHMIFMTDGDACTGVENYTAYGANWWDRRTTGSSPAPTDGCTETGTLTQQVNARTEALCNAIRNQNITLWVISFGDGVSGTAQTRLQNCASPGRFYTASNTAALIDNFRSIAEEIAELRLIS